jgi:hypothetical protein
MMAFLALIVVASLAAIADRLDAAQARNRRGQHSAAALASAKAALIAYAATYRDVHADEAFGYLPCPDMNGAGAEQTPCGKSGTLAIGLLPYKTLGLPDLRDAEGNCLWYAVSGSFKSSPKTSPLNWDSQGDIVVKGPSGTTLAAPDDEHGGAAAIVVAAGPPTGTQRRSAASGGCGVNVAQPGAYIESQGNVFIDGQITDASGVVGNDRVVWITPAEIFDTVVRRSDFADYISAGIEAMRSQLGSQRAKANNLLPANPFGKQATAYSFYEAWGDQFRYLRCSVAGCFADAAGGHHNAMLLFGGRDARGRPRQSSERKLADYFEAALPIAQGQQFSGCSTMPVVFDNASSAGRAADIAVCLAP